MSSSVEKYKVFIFLINPYNSTTNLPPISNIFSENPKFEIVYKDTPKVEIRADTRISVICGKKGCIACGDTHKMKPVTPDYELFKIALEDWRNLSETDKAKTGVIIVKGTTVTTLMSSSTVSEALNDAETASYFNEPERGGVDLFYLAKWLDRADQFCSVKSYSNGTKLVRTWNANGVQALAITPRGLNKLNETYPPETNPVVCRSFSQVLNLLLQNGKLVAATTTPSLLQYDATYVTERPSFGSTSDPYSRHSHLKTAECRGETHAENPLNRRISSDLTFFWVIVVVVVCVFAVWVLLKIGAFYTNPYFSTLTPYAEVVSAVETPTRRRGLGARSKLALL